MPGYEIFWISGSPPCWRVMLAMEVKGLDYTPVRFDNAKGEQKNPDFLKINPRGEVPVLKQGELVVCESLAILAYLDRAHPAPPLFGEDAAETACIWQQILQFDATMPVPIRAITRPIFRGRAAEHSEQIRDAAEKVRPELGTMEGRLANTPYLAGDTISAADIALYPPFMQLMRAAAKQDALDLNLSLHPVSQYFPAIARWAERIAAVPGYDRAYPPHWK